MNKNTFVVGFMLFAIFFGAGNLIFPPKLGFISGEGYSLATLGFVLTGVGLPLLGIIVSGFYEGGYKAALDKINPTFSLIFLMAIYLAIGPFFAIPRTGATSYDLAIVPFLDEPTALSRFVFTLIYFFLALWLSLNPSKMVDRIGAILTPALLIAIFALVVKSLMLLSDNPSPAAADPNQNPLVNGVLEGYQTMDALASLAFSVVVITAIKAKGISGKAVTKQTALSGIVAAIALALVYVSLSWIGNHLPISAETLTDIATKRTNLGTYILNATATETFGVFGRTLLGIIVTLACLTTTIGLIVSVSEYFHEIFPRISYRTYAIIFALMGLVIANQGLDAIISQAVPVLLVLYPITMTVIILLLINIFIPIPMLAQRISVGLVTVVSASPWLASLAEKFPFREFSMEWAIPAVVGCVIGAILHAITKK